ncbi:MAG TPA: Nramp family divalent metal transporter [Candidatus Cloacimonadota bacterium]|nr:Nramp family divalent metal transporter [Candidatus Cloacimonadota bacterium]HPT70728.1 Nramp family divalent metal transporter [Candidatus Cloacimonadota bacterium]
MNFRKIGTLLSKINHKPRLTGLEILKFIGPGLLVTVGFIDPGNWASNIAAGAGYGYHLLWMVTVATIMLVILQHNAAHLGIATGLCISEATTQFVPSAISIPVLITALLAAGFTALAEILGGAIALQMLFHIPIRIGSLLVLGFVFWMLYANSYKILERYIIGFVSLIGLSFIFELSLVHVEWAHASAGWVIPYFPTGSMIIVMSVLGSIVMPHNLFLHSEIIQSRQWNLQDDKVIKHQLKFEFMDTVLAMGVGWAINSAMILVAAATFFNQHIAVTDLNQAQAMLKPMLGNSAAWVFALALLFAGVSSSVTAGMAGGTIFAGMYKESYDIRDWHSKVGVGITLLLATLIIQFISNPFKGLVYSQMLLSIQLPITIFLQIYLTSSSKVMGKHANSTIDKLFLWLTGIVVLVLNVMLFRYLLKTM